MNTQNNMEQRLWEFIDGISSPEERLVIEKLLEDDMAWKTKYRELLQFNELLQSSEVEQPSLRFTKNVMEKIAKMHIAPAAKSYINKKIIWGIAFFFIALLAGILVYGFVQMLGTPDEPTAISKKIGNLDFSKFFNNTWINALMMVNVVIGLFLLDNYLSTKRKQFRKEA